jgi:predicted nucleic acid-binding protein
VRVLLDTSVLVAGLVAAHPMHARALPWLQEAKRGEIALSVAAHTIAELYSVLTTLPVHPRIAPSVARQLIRASVESSATFVALSHADYRAVVNELSERGLSGGVVYDALIARAAEKARAEQLVTLDPDDFRRAWPSVKEIVVLP